jgi:HEAT repeat protein
MPSPPADLAPSPWLAFAIVASTTLGLWLFVRAHRRRERRRSRGHRAELARAIRDFVAKRASVQRLRAEVKRTDPATFWTALEMDVPPLPYAARRRLARGLFPDEHASAERRALRDESPWRRALAARRLALLPSDLTRRALRRALVRGPALVTLAAANALGRHRDRGALRWLLAHPEALAGRTPRSLAGCLRAYGRRALPVLATALDGDIASPLLERAILETLGRGGYRAAAVAIERRLTSESLDVRVAAARALGELRAITSATSLMAALKDDAWQVRAQAARSLGAIPAPVAIVTLEARLTDRSWWVRRHAAYALAELGADGLAVLRRIAESSPDPYARDMAHEVLDRGPTLESA